jgi:hypothetical protein
MLPSGRALCFAPDSDIRTASVFANGGFFIDEYFEEVHVFAGKYLNYFHISSHRGTMILGDMLHAASFNEINSGKKPDALLSHSLRALDSWLMPVRVQFGWTSVGLWAPI